MNMLNIKVHHVRSCCIEGNHGGNPYAWGGGGSFCKRFSGGVLFSPELEKSRKNL